MRMQCDKNLPQKRAQMWLKGLRVSALLIATVGLSACKPPIHLPTEWGTPPASTQSEPPNAVEPVQVPEPATLVDEKLPPAPFELGEKVAQGNSVYREFWGMTTQGGYTVQDFYQNGAHKRTDPYVMTRLEDLQSLMIENSGTIAQQYNALTQSGVGVAGSYVQWYANGRQALGGFFEQNLPSQEWVLNYEDGKIMLQENWFNGMRNGISKGWHANGVLAGQGEYVDGHRQGHWTVWYPNGSKMQEGSYANGKQNGTWVFWYDTGIKKEEGDYSNGQRIGLWKWWTKQGVLAREAEYDEHGQLKGSMGSGAIQGRG